VSSEAIVVLILTVIAIGFIIWVRMNSEDHEVNGQLVRVNVESEETRDIE